MRRFAAFLVLLALLMAAANSVRAADTAAGKAIYDRLCMACHGPNGVGASAPAMNTVAFGQRYNTAAKLGNVARRGARGMPAFGTDLLTDADLENLVAYIDGLAPGGSVPSAAAPTTTAPVASAPVSSPVGSVSPVPVSATSAPVASAPASSPVGSVSPAPVSTTSAPVASAPAFSPSSAPSPSNTDQSLPLPQLYAIAVIALAAVNGLVMVVVWIVVNGRPSG